MFLKRIFNNRFRLLWIHYQHRRKNMAIYEKLDQILFKFHKAGGHVNRAQHYKLFELQALLDKYRPKSIIEYGTGSTTPILVEYARRNAALTCFDEHIKWLENSKAMSSFTVEDDITFIHSPKEEHLIDGVEEVSYQNSNGLSAEFVMIDGPSLTVNGIKNLNIICRDVFLIPIVDLPKIIIIDVRIATVKSMIARLGQYYDYKVTDLSTRTLSNNYRYFSIFILKDVYN
jgi:hypothetical protein